MHLQNLPQFVIVLLATWKLGDVAVPINPMLRAAELRSIIDDCRAVALVGADSDHDAVYRTGLTNSSVRTVITTSPLDWLGGEVPAVLGKPAHDGGQGALDLEALVVEYRGQRPVSPAVGRNDLAVLVYTSGTTGPSKGALLCQQHLVATSTAFGELIRLAEDDVIFGLAPIFHVTGLVLHVMLSFVGAVPLVLAHRFDAAATLDLLERRKATFTIAAITAYTGLMDSGRLVDTDLSSLRAAYTGGAPVPPATVDRWRALTGLYLHNAYGLSESAAPCIAVPLGAGAPVDPGSGALSIGRLLEGTTVKVVGEDDGSVAVGEVGELVVEGPGVVSGYLERPEESAYALRGGSLHTGDVGFIDKRGWVYLVDRKKDLINASGYKVWSREVEDALHDHPAVREAAVVGRPDRYRGETVIAFVSLHRGTEVKPDDLIDFCRERLAAYKRPTEVTVLEELPKTASGKILRRALRESPVWSDRQPEHSQ
jgi:long-chain acyl-CoA synthetase